MLTDFDRNLELSDGLETEYLKLLYYDLHSMSSDYRSYEYSRFCTILEGRKHITVNNGTNFTYNTNQFILLPPHSHVHMDINIPTRALVFELNDELLKRVTERISLDINADYDLLSENRIFHGDISNLLRTCLRKFSILGLNQIKNKEFLLDVYAQELTYYLINIKGVQQVINLEQDNPISKSVKYIQNNIMQPMSVRQLAYNLNMSEANFCNLFKKVMGISPKEYMTNLKLAKARELLKSQNVTEVAFDLGYENISHFITLFKAKYGMTPKQYQKASEPPLVI